MSTSAARLKANRRNARQSTGPKSAAGKARSRANAVTHGLTASVVGLDGGPDSTAAPEPGSLPPEQWRAWLQNQVGRAMVQVDRAQRLEPRLRLVAAHRATAW